MITNPINKIMSPITFLEKSEEAPDTLTFKFAIPKNIHWEAGAYGHFLVFNDENGITFDKKYIREFSIMSLESEGYIGITTRMREEPSYFKQKLMALKPGDKMMLFKMGNHLFPLNQEKPFVFISMGVGVATFRPLMNYYLSSDRPNSTVTNINVDRSGHFVYGDELEKYEDNRLNNIFVTDRNAMYEKLEQCVEHTNNVYYIVGSGKFNHSVGDFLIEKGVAKTSVVFDRK